MADTRIEWAEKVWNPTSGCTRASSGCDNCYAVRMTKRLEAIGQEKYAGLVNIGKGHFNGIVKCHEDELLKPLGWKKGERIFVNSMSDLFHKEVPFEFVDRVFAMMALCPQHTFMILTKRPERMAQYLREGNAPGRCARVVLNIDPCVAGKHWQDLYAWQCHFAQWCDSEGLTDTARWRGPWPLPNVWLGTSVEDQKTADERIPHLLKIPAAVRFLSCEPLLGPVALDNIYLSGCAGSVVLDCLRGIEEWDTDDDSGTSYSEQHVNWVICGGESGPNARPMHPDWARSLRDQCQAAGVPFLFKQVGEWDCYEPAAVHFESAYDKRHIDLHGWPANLTDDPPGWIHDLHPECPTPRVFQRIGKKAAGRLLDGRNWDEFPEVAR